MKLKYFLFTNQKDFYNYINTGCASGDTTINFVDVRSDWFLLNNYNDDNQSQIRLSNTTDGRGIPIFTFDEILYGKKDEFIQEQISKFNNRKRRFMTFLEENELVSVFKTIKDNSKEEEFLFAIAFFKERDGKYTNDELGVCRNIRLITSTKILNMNDSAGYMYNINEKKDNAAIGFDSNIVLRFNNTFRVGLKKSKVTKLLEENSVTPDKIFGIQKYELHEELIMNDTSYYDDLYYVQDWFPTLVIKPNFKDEALELKLPISDIEKAENYVCALKEALYSLIGGKTGDCRSNVEFMEYYSRAMPEINKPVRIHYNCMLCNVD